MPGKLRPTGTREGPFNYAFAMPELRICTRTAIRIPFRTSPDGRWNVRFTYSLAYMHYIRNLSCTRRILLTGRNYKLIMDRQVSPSMTVETASPPLVPAASYRIQVHNAKKNMQIGNIEIVRT